MKKGTPDHWKMRHLARRLNIPERYALAWANGTMERLWHYTAEFHPRGDIGSSPDWAIADACAWETAKRTNRTGSDPAKAGQFVAALVASKWLDVDIPCRLLVHDWAQHCQSSTKKYLKDKGLSFFQPTLNANQSGPPLPLPLPLPLPCAAHAADSEFARFSLPALRFWPDLIEEDLAASWECWLRFDLQTKIAVLKSIEERTEAGEDSRYVTRPPKYLTSGAWKRPVRSSAPPPPAASKTCPRCFMLPCYCAEIAEEKKNGGPSWVKL